MVVVGEVLHLPLEVVGDFNEEEISMVFIISSSYWLQSASEGMLLSCITIIQVFK